MRETRGGPASGEVGVEDAPLVLSKDQQASKKRGSFRFGRRREKGARGL